MLSSYQNGNWEKCNPYFQFTLHKGKAGDLFSQQEMVRASLVRLMEVGKTNLTQEMANETSRRLVFLKKIIMEGLASDALDPGKYKLKLEPNSGSPFSSPFAPIDMRDMLRFEVIETPNGKLVLYGQKSLEATVVKLFREGGFVFYPPPQAVDHAGAIEEVKSCLEHLQGRVDLPAAVRHNRETELKLILANLNFTQGSRDSFLNPKNGGKAKRALEILGRKISEIEAIINEIKEEEKATASRKTEGFKNAKIEPTSQFWPLSDKQAQALAEAINSHKNHVSKKKKRKEPLPLSAHLIEFLESYSTELVSQTRLAPLQQNPSEFVRMIKLAAFFSVQRSMNDPEACLSRASDCGILLNNLANTINSTMSCMEKIAYGVKVLEAMNAKQLRSEPSARIFAFMHLCRLGEARRQLCHELETARNLLSHLTSGKDDSLAPAIPILMAHNYLMVSKREGELFAKFINGISALSHKFPTEFASMSSFASSALAPCIHARGGQPDKKAKKRAPDDYEGYGYNPTAKNRIALLEEKMLTIVDFISKIDKGGIECVCVSSLLKKIIADFKSHLLYKFGGWQACSGSLSFYLTGERLLFETTDNDSQAILVDSNIKLFGLFDKYGFTEDIISALGKFNHRQPNAFDANSDFNKIIRIKSTGRLFPMEYAYSTHKVNDKDGNERVTHTASGIYKKRFNFTIELPESAINFSGPDEFFQDSFEEITLGKSQPLRELMKELTNGKGSRTVNAKNLYRALSWGYIGDKEKYDDARTRMDSAGSPEYLASFSNTRKINGVVFFAKSGKVHANDPLRVGSENTMLSGIEMADQQEAKELADWYLSRVHARIMFHSAHSRKWGWAVECAKRIAYGEDNSSLPKPAP